MKAEATVILGAGLAGLSAAYQMRKRGRPYLCFERQDRPGGLVRSERVSGYTFDYTGHLLHLAQERSRALVLKELGLQGKLRTVRRRSFVYSHGVYTRYPFQSNTHGLPLDVVSGCVRGFVEARLRESARRRPAAPGTFEDWIVRSFGEGIARHFMRPYNTKLWGVPPAGMTTEWMGRFVPRPGLADVLRGALADRQDASGYNASFYYPQRGGIETLSKALARRVRVRTGLAALAVDVRRRTVRFSDGSSARYGRLISSLPLKALVGLMPGAPARIRGAARRLRAVDVLNVNFGVAGRVVSDKHWVYVPEPAFPFYRVGFPHNFSPHMAPSGCSSLYAEISHSKDRPVDKSKAPGRVREGLEAMGILKPRDRVAATFVAEIPGAYVVYDSHRTQAVGEIQSFLRENRIISTGRWGNWEYGSMEDAIWEGAEAALA